MIGNAWRMLYITLLKQTFIMNAMDFWTNDMFLDASDMSTDSATTTVNLERGES